MYVKRLSNTATVPTRGTDGAVGLDLYADLGGPQIGDILIDPGHQMAVPTGIAIAIDEGYAGLIWPRSGLAHKKKVDRRAGVIDPDYRGEVKAIIRNEGKNELRISHGMKIAQLLIMPVWMGDLIDVDELPETVRGSRGFGSTGV